MSTRHLVAYGLIAVIALAAFIWLWMAVLRHSLLRRRSQREFNRARRASAEARAASKPRYQGE